MNITVFTHKEQSQCFKDCISALSKAGSPFECKIYENYDDFISGFPQDNASAVIIARRGADGMESARNAKVMKPNTPLIWFSDDEGFGVESYRIGCTYFSAEAITEKLLSAALMRCKEVC